MSLNKCADDQGICLEMLKFATTETLIIFYEIHERLDFSRPYSRYIAQNYIHDDSKVWGSDFAHKLWTNRYLACILYFLFSRILLPILDRHQSYDQYGFRPGIRLEDAFVVVEGMISKCNEHHLPIWLASLDL